jgi:hypothetical protein
MANKRIFQLPDLSGSISDDDLIVVDKLLNNSVYSTGYKKYVDIANNILARPTSSFTNINTSIGNNANGIANNANAITTLDNSIPGRITTHTLINPATHLTGVTNIAGSTSFVSSTLFQIPIPNNLLSKSIILVKIRYITYVTAQNGGVSTYKLRERTYILTKINSLDFSVAQDFSEPERSGGLNTNDIKIYQSVNVNFGSGINILEFQHKAKNFTNVYHDISVLFYS